MTSHQSDGGMKQQAPDYYPGLEVVPHRDGEFAPEVQPHSGPEVTAPKFDRMEKEVVNEKDQQRGSTSTFARHRKAWIIGAVVAVLIIIAIILGAVLGTRHHNHSSDSNDGSGSSDNSSNSTASASSSPPPASSSTSSSSGPIATPSTDEVAIGKSFNASFTYYGTGDQGAGLNCNVTKNSCGFASKTGYTAAVSQNLFGATFEEGDGLTCSTCWRLTSEKDASGNPLKKDIVVIVNNLCPAQGNPICGQKSLSDLNKWDAQVDFNLCIDSGASDAMFGKNSGIGLATGKAVRVDCKEWKGTKRS